MKDNQIVPVYEFAADQDGIEPMKRKIRKTMEVTEEFTAFEVLQYISKMDKAISDKQAELDGLKSMKEAYLKEMTVVEEQTSVNALQEDFQKNVAEKVNHNNEATSMDKDSVASPYAGEVNDGEANV